MPALARRPFLQLSFGGALAACAGAPAWSARTGRPLTDSPLVGIDPLFIETGLAARWQAAMKQDLGWAARWAPMETGEVLAQLEQGKVDAGLFLSHPRADELDKQGLIFNRSTLAFTKVVLVGPMDDLAGIRSEKDPGRALSQVLAASGAGAARWQPPPAGSALGAMADQLTHGLASKGLVASATPDAKTPARAAPYRLMTQAQWLKAPPRGERLKVWLGDSPSLVLQAQAACSFRSRHAGAKLLLSWLQWPLAQSAVKSARPAWQPMKE